MYFNPVELLALAFLIFGPFIEGPCILDLLMQRLFENSMSKLARKNKSTLAFLGFMSKQAPIPKRELKTSFLLIASIVGVIALSSLLLVTQYWFVWPVIIACLVVTVGYFTASKDVYQCPSCEKTFKITALQDFFAPHGITKNSNGQLFEWKLLKCLECNKREKCFRAKE